MVTELSLEVEKKQEVEAEVRCLKVLSLTARMDQGLSGVPEKSRQGLKMALLNRISHYLWHSTRVAEFEETNAGMHCSGITEKLL